MPHTTTTCRRLTHTRVSVARYEAGMRRIPGVVSVVLNQLRQKTSIPMAGLVAAGSPIEPVPQSELVGSLRACCGGEIPLH